MILPEENRSKTHGDVCVYKITMYTDLATKMGGKSSKQEQNPEGPIVATMLMKYGPNSTKHLLTWYVDYGFPKGGSLSVNQLIQLEDKLKKVEEEMRKKKKIKTTDLDEIDSHKQCFNMWKEEAERREKKKCTRLYPRLKTRDKSAVSCSILQIDPNLDAFPPPQQPPLHQQPPIYGAAAAPLPENAAATTSTTTAKAPPPSLWVTAASSTPFRSTSPVDSSAPFLRSMMRNLQLPMIQAAGADGPQMVFRPWTMADIEQALVHLPDLTSDGEKFAEGLLQFCMEFGPTEPELKRLMMKKLGPTNFAKLIAGPPNAVSLNENSFSSHHQWNNEANAAYVNLINKLGAAFKTAFPKKVDMPKMTSCKQKPGEGLETFTIASTSSTSTVA